MNVCGVPVQVLIAAILATTLRVATPLTLGALGGLYSERSGVVNIAIEGMMLMGAFSAFVVGALTNSFFIGVLAALVAAGLMALLHAVLSVTFRVDQIISGTVVNILALGITGFFFDQYSPRTPLTPVRLRTGIYRSCRNYRFSASFSARSRSCGPHWLWLRKPFRAILHEVGASYPCGG